MFVVFKSENDKANEMIEEIKKLSPGDVIFASDEDFHILENLIATKKVNVKKIGKNRFVVKDFVEKNKIAYFVKNNSPVTRSRLMANLHISKVQMNEFDEICHKYGIEKLNTTPAVYRIAVT